MILFGCFIVGLGGLDFVVEVSDVSVDVVIAYLDGPFALRFVPSNALVF